MPWGYLSASTVFHRRRPSSNLSIAVRANCFADRRVAAVAERPVQETNPPAANGALQPAHLPS
jgi:hypothetical protein